MVARHSLGRILEGFSVDGTVVILWSLLKLGIGMMDAPVCHLEWTGEPTEFGSLEKSSVTYSGDS